MDKIILIGGSPTTGKSYLARELSNTFKLPWISTDTVRDQMREIVNTKQYPMLFMHSKADADMADKYLTSNTPKQIVEHQNQESEEVWKGVKAIIETDYVWNSFIVEGVAVIPKLVNTIKLSNKKILPIFLVDNNVKRIKNTIYTRGLWDDADKYPDHLKDIEINWVLEFNNYLLKECLKYNYPVIEISNRKHTLNQVVNVIDRG